MKHPLDQYECEKRGDAFIYTGISNEDYHSDIGISSSTCENLVRASYTRLN